MSINKQTIAIVLSDPRFVDAAIVILGENQTADELRTKGTHHHNGIGFSACYGKTGTCLYEFVTGISTRTGQKKWQPKSLSHPMANRVFSRRIANYGLSSAEELGRHIATHHWRQLEAILEPNFVPPQLPTEKEPSPAPPEPKVTTTVLRGITVRKMTAKAVRICWDGRNIWLPKSQVKYDSATNELTLPIWLARNKKLEA